MAYLSTVIIVNRLVVHIVTQLHQDNVRVISLLDNVPMDVDPYRIPHMSIGTLETNAIFTSVSKVFIIKLCVYGYLKRSAIMIMLIFIRDFIV